ncbi:unnamed protein product [Rotaria sp. Silwood1]|nr:unnamed protein product [Rotaria sp. Silwood1]
MSYDSRIIIDDNNSMNNNSDVTDHRRDLESQSTVHCPFIPSVNYQQLQIDLRAQREHEKDTLNELNQRLKLFTERVQLLQSDNSKYLTDISNLRQNLSGLSNIDVTWDERYLSLNSSCSTLTNDKINFNSDFEMYQLQIGIYQTLIEIQQDSKNKRIFALEEELKQSASQLTSLRSSYTNLGRDIEDNYNERDNLLKQYLSLTHDFAKLIKQRQQLNLSVETLKRHISFYKNLSSYSVREFASSSITTEDDTLFWRSELENIIKAIRSDFEVFYGKISREMLACYEKKIVEMQKYVQDISTCQPSLTKEFSIVNEKLQIEYEQVTKNLSYEKEIQIKLQTTYAELETEYKSIQLRNKEQYEAIPNETDNLKESILSLICDIHQMQCSKDTLEAEIIVYKHLLSGHQIEIKKRVVTPLCPSAGSELIRKINIKRYRQGCIGIDECTLDGTYISLISHLATNEIDLSRWKLQQNTDSSKQLQYIIPDGTRIERNGTIRIYSKTGSIAADAASSSGQKLVNNDIVSWITGNMVDTRLFNQNVLSTSAEENKQIIQHISNSFSTQTFNPVEESILEAIARELRHAKRVLAITGAGISADSGLPTYRGIGGLYSDGKETEDGMPIEEALSGYTMNTRPDICWKYIYQIESACRAAKPNAAHQALVALQSKFKQFTVLTQNVDGLHRSAGTKNLIEIHGNIQDLFCISCGHEKHVPNFEGMKIPPKCDRCNSLVRPRVVLFGEMLPIRAVGQLYEIMDKGLDAVISIGTTSVFPYIAEPVVRAAQKNAITIEINPGDTEVSDVVRYRLRDRSINILPKLLKHLS